MDKPYPAPILKLFCSSLIWPNYKTRTVAAETLKNLCVVEGAKLRTALAECFLEAINDNSLDEVCFVYLIATVSPMFLGI